MHHVISNPRARERARNLLVLEGEAGSSSPRIICHADRLASHLRCASPALYHLFLLQRLPFLRTARNRDRFLSILEQTRGRYRFVVLGYVVMPEHIHLLITEPEIGTPSTVMQVLKQRTARALLPKQKRPEPRQRAFFGDTPPHVFLAGAFLRLQCLDDDQARRETEVYAPESGEARFGELA